MTSDSAPSPPCASSHDPLRERRRGAATKHVNGPLRERRRGAADECRSDARNTPPDQQLDPKTSVGFARDERGGLQRPVRERNPKKMGEAPVKYELTGAS